MSPNLNTETRTVWPCETSEIGASATLVALYPYCVRDASGPLDFYRTRSAALYVARQANRGALGHRPHATLGARFQPHATAAPTGAHLAPTAGQRQRMRMESSYLVGARA